MVVLCTWSQHPLLLYSGGQEHNPTPQMEVLAYGVNYFSIQLNRSEMEERSPDQLQMPREHRSILACLSLVC